MKNLPEYCWSVLDATNELVMVKSGERGYYPQRPDVEPWGAENKDVLNERLGVTKGEAEAMKAGSMFGWDTPASDPNNYDEEGNWIKVR